MESVYLSQDQHEVILALADNGMKVSEVARKMYTSRQSIDRHIDIIRKLTGKDPLNFYDLYDLLLFVKGVFYLYGGSDNAGR